MVVGDGEQVIYLLHPFASKWCSMLLRARTQGDRSPAARVIKKKKKKKIIASYCIFLT
jgi:hypothetical protein